MVYMEEHGGGCCGARHLVGFDDAVPLDNIDRALAQVPLERMVEVILNQRQVDSRQGVLDRLAAHGFVLDGHWINGNHNRDNYRFTRCDNRLPLVLPNWNGMVADPALEGRLDPILGATGQTRTAGGRFDGRGRGVEPAVQRHTLNRMQNNRPYPLPTAPVAPPQPAAPVAGVIGVGSRVRRVNTNLAVDVRIGHIGTVVEARLQGNPPNRKWWVLWDGVPERRWSNENNLALVQAADPQAQALARTVVGSTYHCVFRGGRRGAGYDTLAEAVAQLGRRTRIDRRDFYNTAPHSVWTENVPHV